MEKIVAGWNDTGHVARSKRFFFFFLQRLHLLQYKGRIRIRSRRLNIYEPGAVRVYGTVQSNNVGKMFWWSVPSEVSQVKTFAITSGPKELIERREEVSCMFTFRETERTRR